MCTSMSFCSQIWHCIMDHSSTGTSGGFRNSERGVQPLAREARPQIFGLPRPLSVTLEVRTEYLEATLGLVKCLEISKELIRECVTMPGCCCCMPLLHNHLIDSCSYVRKNRLLAAKGGCKCTPLTPHPESATAVHIAKPEEQKNGGGLHGNEASYSLLKSFSFPIPGNTPVSLWRFGW